MSEQCGDCRFWRRRSDNAGDSGGGYCVRFPPFAPSSWKLYRDEMLPGDDHLNDAWPMVHEQSWCGEYSASPTT